MTDNLDPGPAPMPDVVWHISREGRAWTADEAMARYEENVGADQAVRLGDPEVWRAAVRELG